MVKGYSEVKVRNVIGETEKSWKVQDWAGGVTYLAFSNAVLDRTESDGVVFLVKNWLAKKMPQAECMV